MIFDIDRIITDYYQNQFLSNEIKEKILNTIYHQETATGKFEQKYVYFINSILQRIRTAWALYAVCLGIILFIISFLPMLYQLSGSGLKHRIIKEVRLNHEKNLELNIKGHHMPELQQQMDELNFALIPLPDRIEHYFIMGARYCSINGEIAALIRLQDMNKKPYTIYQTAFKKHYRSFSKAIHSNGKFTIEFNVSRGVMLIIAASNN